MPQSFDDQQSPYPILEPQTVPIAGNMMIEASAGTGKTYTITLLVLRLLLGLNVDRTPKKLPEILIVTFTNAATAELKERIYSRIVDLKQAFFSDLLELPVEDDALQTLIAHYLTQAEAEGMDRDAALETAINLLNQAEGAIDQASIFTIHAFSQRLLKENALDLGQSFHFELSTDLSALYREAVYHFWREECYPLKLELSRFVSHYFDVPISEGTGLYRQASLFSKVEALIRDPSLITHALFAGIDSLDALFSEQLAQINAVKARMLAEFSLDDFTKLIEEVGLKKQSYRADLVKRYHAEFRAWAESESPALFVNYEKFTLAFMESRLAKGGDLSRMPVNLRTIFEALTTIERFKTTSFHYAAWKIVQILKMLKHDAGVLGFDDLLTELNQKTATLSESFLKSLHLRYRAVMIDEFQDTDHLQLETFRRLFFNHEEIPFVMIGDPKQSIYGFRGADINAYLSIKEDVANIYTLNRNYRSGLMQVNAVNSLFGRRDFLRPAFVHDNIPFIEIETPASAAETVLNEPDRATSGMTVLNYEPDEAELTFTKKGEASFSNPQFRERISRACAKEITALLAHGTLDTSDESRKIQPEDITILVRSGTEASDIQKALRMAGLNSVYLSERNSVFDPDNSIVTDLYLFLRSLIFKHEKTILMQSLGSVLYGMSVTEFEEVKRDPERLETLLFERNELNDIWDQHGVLAMIRAFMVRENRLAKLLLLENGERFASDLFHLGELLQRESFSNKEALLLWLHDKMFGYEEGEGAEIRLESDFKTIQVMTIHKSKGLEFPIVFLPFGLFKTQAKSEGVYVDPTTHQRHYVFAGDATEAEKDYFRKEALAEDIRLLYVALTRAKYHTYIGFCRMLKKDVYQDNALSYLMGLEMGFDHLEDTKSTEDNKDGGNAAFLANFNSYLHLQEVDSSMLQLDAPSLEKSAEAVTLPATFTRKISPLWRFTSFSNLSYNAQSSYFTPLLEDEREFEAEISPSIAIAESLFPKGAVTGNFIHELLENYSPLELEDRSLLLREVTSAFTHLVRAEKLPHLVDELELWLTDILQAPLSLASPVQQTLREILSSKRQIKELEFIFPIESRLTKDALNNLLQQHLPREAGEGLKFEALAGFLRGFIDLFFEADGKYYVADYKSNTLGTRKSDYTLAQMAHSIKHAHYDLQYLIYTVAAVKFLQNIQPDFDYDRDFGGVIYFYLRGMSQTEDYGIYYVKPDYDLVLALMALFDNAEKDSFTNGCFTADTDIDTHFEEENRGASYER